MLPWPLQRPSAVEERGRNRGRENGHGSGCGRGKHAQSESETERAGSDGLADHSDRGIMSRTASFPPRKASPRPAAKAAGEAPCEAWHRRQGGFASPLHAVGGSAKKSQPRQSGAAGFRIDGGRAREPPPKPAYEASLASCASSSVVSPPGMRFNPAAWLDCPRPEYSAQDAVP